MNVIKAKVYEFILFVFFIENDVEKSVSKNDEFNNPAGFVHLLLLVSILNKISLFVHYTLSENLPLIYGFDIAPTKSGKGLSLNIFFVSNISCGVTT